MKNIVIDLEMCKVPAAMRKRGFRMHYEIIQIGAVMLDENWEEISGYTAFVRPKFGYVDQFISKLTGIHEFEVKAADCLADAMHSFLTWAGLGENPEAWGEFRVYAWSNSDLHQLSKEMAEKQIEDPVLQAFVDPQYWVDYQHVFRERYHMGRDVALKEALDLIAVDAEGRAHNGLVDASNTGRLIAKMELDPDLQLCEAYRRACEEETDHLSVSMAGLLSGIKLA